MRYPPHILEEIRARLPASDVIGRRVRLKKAGREWRGLSPFNSEKTPSFYVNDQKQFYHCFSSGKHGDVFTFLMETEGLSFPEAVERLAGEAGVSLPAPSADTRALESKRRGAVEVMEMAASFFEEQLRGPAGAAARAYLDKRSLGADIQAKFRMGYAPAGRYVLRDHLAAKDVEKALMGELGLLVTGEDIAVPYDRFRDRIIFPICDIRGRVIAFGGRAMQADAKAKYLNSPETPLFHKGQGLYNIHQARKAAHERGTIIAVEGYVDTIAMTLAGHPNTVASLGTALTEEQLGLLWRHADEPILCFDGDKAGQRAAYKALEVALPLITPQKKLRFAFLPQGQDPDDLFREGGSNAIDKFISKANKISDVIVGKHLYSGSNNSAERIAQFRQSIGEEILKIKDNVVQQDFLQEISRRFGSKGSRDKFSPRRNRGQWSGRENDFKITNIIRSGASPLLASSRGFHGGSSPREAMIVATLLAHPDLLGAQEEVLADLDFEDADAVALRSFLLDRAAEGEEGTAEVLEARLKRIGLDGAAARLAARVRPGDRWALDPFADRMRLDDALGQAVILHRKAGALNSELRQAERALVEEETEANFAWLCDVKERLAVIAGAETDAELPETTDSTDA